MKRLTGDRFMLAALVAGGLWGATARADLVTYRFTKIAETTSGFRSIISQQASINDAGTVLFQAQQLDGTDGIFVGDGSSLTQIAAGIHFNLTGAQQINNLDEVVFRGTQDSTERIFLWSGGKLKTIYDTYTRPGGSFSSFRGDPAINDSGSVLLAGCGFQAGDAIFRGDRNGSTPAVLVKAADPPYFGSPYFWAQTIASDDTIAFKGWLWSGHEGIYTQRPGGPLQTVAETTGPFFCPGAPKINNRGEVVFSECHLAGKESLYLWRAGEITKILDADGAFDTFSWPDLNDHGQVAFRGASFAGGSAIYAGIDLTGDRVIGTGDELFGGQVTSLYFGAGGLNNSGQLAFFARRNHPVTGAFMSDGIYVATPLVEPEQWKLAGGGSYNDPSNWTDETVPDGVDEVANFLGNITGRSTVTVHSPVTVGTLNFDNENSYTIAGPAEIALKTSSGVGWINVLNGNHTISAPFSPAPNALRVDTQGTASLTIILESLAVGPPGLTLIKKGPGTWVVNGGVALLGPINLNGGSLELDKDLLAHSGGDVNIASGATLKASGVVNRRVYGDLTTQIIPQGNLIIGHADDGYTYGGYLKTAGYSLTLVHPEFPHKVDSTIVGGAKIPGADLQNGTLSTTHGLHLLGVDFGNMYRTFLTGHGTVHGYVAAGDPLGGLGWIKPGVGKKITFTGNLQGSYAIVGDVEVLGLEIPSWSPGPSYNFNRPEIGAVTLNVAGEEEPYIPAPVDLAKEIKVEIPAEGYSMLFVAGFARTTLNGTLKVQLDPDVTPPYEFRAGDDLYLVWAGPAVLGTEIPGATLAYGPNFKLDLPPLTGGLYWDEPSFRFTSQHVYVRVIPEPGTLVLLLSGGLCGLAYALRRSRRRSSPTDGIVAAWGSLARTGAAGADPRTVP